MHLRGGCRGSLIAARLFLALLLTAANAADASYYCLEDYKPIGTLLQQVPVSNSSNSTNHSTTNSTTGGQVARACAAACDATPGCSGFRAVGPDVRGANGSSCQLLANSTASLPQALALASDSEPWPRVNANLTAADGIALRSIAWMCWRQQADWDAFGAATHRLIVSGSVGGEGSSPGQPADHSDWCAFGVDVAGTNLRRDTINITAPAQCDEICRTNATGCTFWIFVASQPEQVQFQPARNCFSKADAFRGQNGWTGKPKSDIWNPDSQVTCFGSLSDWRHLGLVLSPSIKTIQHGSLFYTVYPERITWPEASAICAQLPGRGQLAVLDSQGLLDAVSRDLLDTLPFQTAVRSAWVGATGNNTAFNPAAVDVATLTAGSGGAEDPDVTRRVVSQQRQPDQATGPRTENTLRWSSGAEVAPGMLRRPDTLVQLWTVHDVVWSQQYVPESSRGVCGRVMVQLPSSSGPTAGALNPSSVLPGVWYYDCAKPAAFICQSSSAPTEPMSGRVVTPGLAAPAAPNDSAGSGGGQQPWKTALAVILPVLAVTLLAWQVFHVYSRKISRLPELVRQQRKRALGQPRTGRMSLVVTDIQGFTQLMQGHPDHTTQALLLHNSCIKHAVYNNVGWVVEQEGDSFSVVFHEPEDACTFTLQVQQALLQQTWPQSVTYHDDWEGAASILDCRSASQQREQRASLDTPTAAAALALEPSFAHPPAGTPQGSFSTWQLHDQAAAAAEAPAASQASSCSPRLAALLHLKPAAGGRSSSSFTAGAGTGAGRPLAHRRSHSLDNGTPGDQQQQQQHQGLERGDSVMSSDSAALAARAAALGLAEAPGFPAHARQLSATSEDARGFWSWARGSQQTPAAGMLSPAGASYSTAAGVPPGSGSRKSMLGASRPRNLWLFQQLLGPRQEHDQLFRGLRVRMGVVTGVVERGQELKSSELYRRAQDVSGAAHGGQVLVCETTFSAVKESLWRLGAVGPNGLDHDALLASKSAQHGSARHRRNSSGGGGNGSCLGDGCLPGMLSGSSFRGDASSLSAGSQLAAGSPSNSDMALALDMGAYEVLSPSDPAYISANNASSSSRGAACVPLWTRELGDRLVQQYQHYIQQQLDTRQGCAEEEEGLDNSFDEEAPYMVSAAAPQGRQHRHLQQQQQQQQLRQLSAGSAKAHSSKLFSGGAGGAAAPRDAAVSGAQLMRAQHPYQQQQHSLAGRSASATLQPYSWSQVASSLFGVETVPAANSMADSHGSQQLMAVGRHAQQPLAYGSTTSAAVVRLYQLAPPSLAGRAALFGQHLDVPHTWRLLDLPYFAAPGLSSASFAAPAAEAAADTPQQQQLRQRVPGRSSSEVSAWQQRIPTGRTSSEVHPLPQQQEQLLLQQRSSSAHELAALQQAQQEAPAAAAAHTSPFLCAAQRSLSSSEDRLSSYDAHAQQPAADAVAAATAAAAAAAVTAGPGGAGLRLQHAGGQDGAALSTELALPQEPTSPASQPTSPAAAGGGGLAPSQSLLVLRAASLQLNVAPSLLLAATAAAAAGTDRRSGGGSGSGSGSISGSGAGGQQRARMHAMPGPARALFPPVTILFAAVEGAGELLQHPSLARSVHAMVHRLMLQLLRAFPGSYLVRAQQGDMRYMCAFTHPAAAVAWGLTLQEASLYQPYPQAVLGLSSFGVQLDACGRLVFRGPRFKMGLAEGTPKVVMPDHMGRADYHASFVNLAARYTAVAAQGGQLVADADTARAVLQHWKTSGHSHSAAEAAAAALADGGGAGERAARLSDASSSSVAAAALPSAGAAGTSSTSHVLVIRSAAAAAGATATAQVPVECSWLGSFMFKGNPTAVSIVSFCPAVLAGRQYASSPAAAASSKGVRVLQRVGVMDRTVVALPAVVEGFLGPRGDAAAAGQGAAVEELSEW